jgi:prepilin-type N-terminal cleavage/methylation domain-containing protein
LGGGFGLRPSSLDPRPPGAPKQNEGGSTFVPRPVSGFTMIEIAICLAIIGIALVAIIGVLPMGLNVQKDNREETVINQDATVFMEYIRNGARGADDLTNYVFAIVNKGTIPFNYINLLAGPMNYASYSPGGVNYLTSGARIVGLLSTPEFVNNSYAPTNFANATYSNYVVAYVCSISGPASEKPLQDNGTVRGDSFSYKIICENVPVTVDTNVFNLPPDQQLYARQLTANLHELRLTFLWPLLPNGKTGNGRQTFRTTVAGQIVQTNDTSVTPKQMLYFFQPQSFTNAP